MKSTKLNHKICKNIEPHRLSNIHGGKISGEKSNLSLNLFFSTIISPSSLAYLHNRGDTDRRRRHRMSSCLGAVDNEERQQQQNPNPPPPNPPSGCSPEQRHRWPSSARIPLEPPLSWLPRPHVWHQPRRQAPMASPPSCPSTAALACAERKEKRRSAARRRPRVW
uniref:Uncharacterized protein n=1 Tax=Arundo donax TaxID=35708 RepID=A0A0A9DTG6_ARUDO